MEQRLRELRADYERGLRQLARLDAQRQEVQHTLLRISGAVQVLEELLAQTPAAPPEPPAPAEEAALRAVGA